MSCVLSTSKEPLNLRAQMRHVPNILSGFRLALIPAFCMLFFSDARTLAGIVFVLAAVTDAIDGYIARKYDAITKLGRLLDPMADKLMQFSALVCLAIADEISIWFAMVYMTKELVMLFGGVKLLRTVADVMPSKILGKTAAVLFYLAIAIIICFETSLKFRYILLTVCLTLTFIALIDYILSYSKYVKVKKNK